MNKTMSTKSVITGLLLLLVSTLALAEMSLDDAKAQGLVGEDSTGYLAAVVATPSREVRALINDVNEKRREEYERIAEANKIKVKDVEKLAAKKAIEKTSRGHFVRLPGGTWQPK